MKICYFIASKGLGRGEAYIDLANALSGTIEIILLVPKGALFIPRVDKKIRIVEYQSKDSRRNPFLYFELYYKLKQIKPDIVHCHFAKATAVYYKLNPFLNIPWVSTKHNLRKGHIFNKVDRVIAVSTRVADSIAHNRVSVIHNGILPEVLSPMEEQNKTFIIIAVGRLEKVKAFDQLITECAKLTFDFKLLIVGDGPEKGSLDDLVRTLGLNGKVEFLGYREDVPKLMQQADIIVVCSHSEGFSLVILEGLFYGNVLISRAVGIADNILSDMFLIKEYEISSRLEDVFRNYNYFKSEFESIRKLKGPEYLMKNSSDRHIKFYQEMLSGND